MKNQPKVIDWPFPTLENPLRPTGEKQVEYKNNTGPNWAKEIKTDKACNMNYSLDDMEDALL